MRPSPVRSIAGPVLVGAVGRISAPDADILLRRLDDAYRARVTDTLAPTIYHLSSSVNDNIVLDVTDSQTPVTTTRW
jgi:hypothetical protein